jgi:lysozyme
MQKNLEERVKEHEGFRSSVYLDSLGKATIGWGHLITKEDKYEEGIEYSVEDLEETFQLDLENARQGAMRVAQSNDIDLDDHESIVREVLIEMVFQLGESGVGKFKKFLSNLSQRKYEIASDEMLDSRWAMQTPHRAEKLSYIIRVLAH